VYEGQLFHLLPFYLLGEWEWSDRFGNISDGVTKGIEYWRNLVVFWTDYVFL
jgi:hypothetical protein